MFRKLRTSRWGRILAMYIAISMLAEIIAPLRIFALTGGPSQPEVQSFEPINTSEMVNLFTGDFTYNIPLLDVGGYPINMSYSSGITSDQEASWTGLGWNVNPGAITRNMRGMPDDFDGELITRKFNMEPNRTWGLNTGLGVEAFGWDNFNLNYGISINYNNYVGVGFEQSVNMSISSGKGGKGPFTGGLGITSGADGLTLNPSVSFSARAENKAKEDIRVGGNLGLSFNSRSGLKNLSLGVNASVRKEDSRFDKPVSASLGSSSASFNFGTATYSPQVNMSMLNTSVNLSFKTGIHIFGGDGSFNIGGYYSEQRLKDKELKLPAFGYLNSEKAIPFDNALLDFNRENDAGFSENTPALPVTNHTYDIYSVAGQGIGGSYRPFRNDLGYVYDNESGTYSDSYALGVEIDGTNALHGGVDVSVTGVITESGRWEHENEAEQALRFRNSTGSASYDPIYERYNFKEAGEKSVDSDGAFFNSMGAFDPVRVKLQNAGAMLVRGENQFVRQTGPSSNITQNMPSLNYRNARQRRNQNVSTLSKSEAAVFGLQKDIYTGTNPDYPINAAAKEHHIAEMTVLRTDGSRYIYGLPAYNTTQKDVSFNASGISNTDCSTGLVYYQNGDNSTSNNRGVDHFYNSSEMPAYAHSYMLTAIVSADYVDLTGDGPSADDLGTWTKLNYKRLKKPSNNQTEYRWRIPFETNSANYSEGLKTDDNDSRGSYLYGTKEIWYVTSVETKNYIAVFETKSRADGYGVSGENGGFSSANDLSMELLKSISLYTRPEYFDALGNVNPNAVPIKSVHFVYDYSLCPGVPNNHTGATLDPQCEKQNQGGKLTLKELYFTYGTSKKGRTSKYLFSYNSTNPSYGLKNYDRWGNYKPNPANPSCAPSGALLNAEFPYTDQYQSQTQADQNASAWELTDIKLPSGGEIQVKYEADDYAYVQDRQAMEMIRMYGIGTTPGVLPAPGSNLLMDQHTIGEELSRDYLFFKLPTPITDVPATSQADDEETFYQRYLRGYIDGTGVKKRIENLYFRFLVDLKASQAQHEFVSGYAEIDWDSPYAYGLVNPATDPDPSTDYQYGYIRLKRVGVNDDAGGATANPVSRAAWQFGRLNAPQVVWDQPNVTDAPIDQFITALGNANIFDNIIQMFEGPNRSLRNKDYGKYIVPGKSWIRLFTPFGKKYGGGSRVKELVMDDNWQGMSTPQQEEAHYGQKYSYTTTDVQQKGTISSGVAAYEPSVGGDENTFKQPVWFGDRGHALLAPDDKHYMEEPFGESFFPSPVVGYSKVTVTNLTDAPPSGGTLNRHGTGKVEHEFYTAKDFPTITRRTDLDMKPKKTNPILSLLKISAQDFMTASQGFVVELNDMHGKPKGQTVYAEGQNTPLSSIAYIYKTQSGNPKHLSNSCPVIKKDGSIGEEQIGVDYDFVADFRQQHTLVLNAGVNINLAGFVVGVFPAIVPTVFPSFSMEETQFRSAGVTKVINRYGILEKTVAYDLGSTVSTNNLAYDAETGEVLLTQTKNDFEDEIYSLSYPAHWGYDRMAQAYRNIGSTFSNVSIGGGGSATVSYGAGVFVKGDEVAVNNSARAWVCDVAETGNDATISLIDQAGQPWTNVSNATLKILRSGRRNQQLSSIGKAVSLINPIDNNNDGIYEPVIHLDKVLTTDAAQFSEEWGMFCGVAPDENSGCGCTATPQADALKAFLDKLAESNKLVQPTPLTIFNSGTYSYNYSATLHSLLTPQAPVATWSSNPIVGGTHLNGVITYNGTIGTCPVSAVLPAGYNWSEVTNVLSLGTNMEIMGDCVPNMQSFVAVVEVTQNGVKTLVEVIGSTSCFTIANCVVVNNSSPGCGITTGTTVNPYVQGLRGNWRPVRSYLYQAEREQQLNIRNDGIIITRDHVSGLPIAFQPFWNPNGSQPWSADPAYWTFTSEVTQYSPFGAELETRDALGRYSAAQYGYNQSLPVAVAANARYRDIAFDGFEDYDFYPNSMLCGHLEFISNTTNRVTTEHHTGRYSMKVLPNTPVQTSRRLTAEVCPTGTPGCPYTLECKDCIGNFAPVTFEGNKRFVMSYWVKQATPAGQAPPLNYPNANITVSINNTTLVLSNVHQSEIIEGWQRVEAEFTITGGTNGVITVSLNNSGTQNAFFDDLRIQPFNSSMKTYVYHTGNLRYTAALDENNYATFYEYDAEGSLVRVKKETERGIMTIQESRQANHK